ncbi:putative 115 kDa protein in type-1 retrotransposable element R1DM [Bicyclus anynana]|uniref:115 kDa protein in type-1 retrotransposable element R1DM n=1 Tax=Bicyclus anynana TaxID=110368 RepID=A0ABM3LNW9_BICAN|nr:putative 115 kDa protein in type-1 retrotransposable element R1DM [Bicyclus anynana]
MQAKVVHRGNGFIAVAISGLTLYSCYFSPNYSFEEFEQDTNDLFDSIQTQRGEIIVAGDFNAASKVWSKKSENARGRHIMELLASKDMVIVNAGDRPTFQRGPKNSTPDITFASFGLAQQIVEWQVLDEDSLSGHCYIKFQVSQNKDVLLTQPQLGWKLNEIDQEKMVEILKKDENEISTPEELVVLTTRACDKAMPKKGLPRKSPVYWWNREIGEKRKYCTSCRRKYTRERRKNKRGPINTDGAADQGIQKKREEYKSAKIALQIAIMKSKTEEWKKLCDEVDKDTWGLGYKIVTKKMRPRPPGLEMELIKSVAAVLFPAHKTFGRIIADDSQPVDVTEDELKTAAENLKPKKAPGPDFLYPEIVKLAVQAIPEKIRQIMDAAFKSGVFPAVWKTAKLILLRKANKPKDDPSGYRPVCLLDCYGKLMERLLVNRIEKLLPEHGGLSEHQYGFRQGRSTLMAIKRVVETAVVAKQGSRRTRRLCALICLDVKNAFNSAPWKEILLEIRKRGLPGYLQNLLSSYLEDRSIIVRDNKGVTEVITVSSGVPQGSILGPTLWNILYDGVFTLEQEEGVQVLGFADDLAIVVVAKTEISLMSRANRALERVNAWMQKKQLALAPEKTEAVVFSGRRKLQPINFSIQGTAVTPKDHVKYLGVWLDKNISFKTHIEEVAQKAQKLTEVLCRLMPTRGGPRASRRRILASVAHSTILYGAPLFKKAMNVELYRKKLETVQRRLAIGVCGAYRTVSTEAVLVIAGLVPIDKLVKERALLFEKKDQNPHETRENTLKEWEREWSGAGKGSWTRELIPDLKAWLHRKHGEVDRWLTQALSGHGVLNTYLFAIGKAPHEKCYFCGEEDNPRHALFECPGCADVTAEAQETGEFNAQTLVARMLESENEWHKCANTLRTIMVRRETRERQEKKGCEE